MSESDFKVLNKHKEPSSEKHYSLSEAIKIKLIYIANL